MASLLRQIVAGPRARHPEAGLDLCYVTNNIVATSGPSSTYPKKAYRNPTDQLVKFLDYKHGKDWSIFEFRAEGTGYPDSEVYNRIHHFPWPDHHPPPFAIIPPLMAAMRNWLQGEDVKGVDGIVNKNTKQNRVAVVHCKAGKGRSGTVTTAYLISEEGWEVADALQRFTERRMRQGFGEGVSIPSQLRWVSYVDRWANQLNKTYIERRVEIVEIHVWGLRDGVKVSVEGYVEEGRRIEVFHTFTRKEKIVVDNGKSPSQSQSASQSSKDTTTSTNSSRSRNTIKNPSEANAQILSSPTVSSPSGSTTNFGSYPTVPAGQTVLLKPTSPVIVPTSDVNIDFERRNKAAYTGWTMVTSVAHVWFNAYFEGGAEGNTSGVFEIEWDAMDGIKGSSRKGTRALDKVKVLWRYADPEEKEVIKEPAKGEPVLEPHPADWRGENDTGEEKIRDRKDSAGGLSDGRPGGAGLTVAATVAEGAGMLGKELGLRKENPASADISRASSLKDVPREASKLSHTEGKSKEVKKEDESEGEELEGVQTRGPEGEEHVVMEDDGEGGHMAAEDGSKNRPFEGGEADDGDIGGDRRRPASDVGVGKAANIAKGMKDSTLNEDEEK